MAPTQDHSRMAIDYKKNIAGKFALVESKDLKHRIGDSRMCVTRKIDGHLQIAFYQHGETFLLNSNGRQRVESIKCIDSFTEALKEAGIKQAVIATELYMPCPDGRPRHGDVATALTSENRRDALCLAPFDIIELDGEKWSASHYCETHKKLCEIFKAEEVKPVEMREATTLDDVLEIYKEWVDGEDAEGLVLHTEGTIVWKVKHRHTIDAAVVGYTTSERGISSLMFAVRREDGLFQHFVEGSTGMTDEERADVAERLSHMHVDSQYILSDVRGIAYQMVRPEMVYEFTVLDLTARGNDDKIKLNSLLRWDENSGWLMEGTTPGVSATGITLVRERTDKTTDTVDVRVSQLSDICPFEEIESNTKSEPSTLLARKVYKKVSGAKVMLHKFLLWKTNKEQTGRFPAYIVYHTDFSSGRKEMIKRSMSYTSDETQAHELFDAEIADNIKKGWEEIV